MMILSDSNSWTDFRWPKWVPLELRSEIASFWRESYGRGPKAYLADYVNAKSFYVLPNMGEIATFPKAGNRSGTESGRYIHCWNNIGRVIRDDNTVGYISYARGENYALR